MSTVEPTATSHQLRNPMAVIALAFALLGLGLPAVVFAAVSIWETDDGEPGATMNGWALGLGILECLVWIAAFLFLAR